jgi:hypothetical protein
MKWDIQQQLQREVQEYGKEEAARRQWERVMNNPWSFCTGCTTGCGGT